MALTVKQRGVLNGIIAGAAITFVVILGAILVGPSALPAEASAGERLAFAIRADAFIALWLGISVGLLARHRFFTPEDIDGGGLFSWLGNRERSAINPSKHAGAVGSGGASASSVVDSDASILDIGDTSRRLSLLVWPCPIYAWISWRGAISGGRVCSNLLPIRADAHIRDRYSRIKTVGLELVARWQLTSSCMARACS